MAERRSDVLPFGHRRDEGRPLPAALLRRQEGDVAPRGQTPDRLLQNPGETRRETEETRVLPPGAEEGEMAAAAAAKATDCGWSL